MPETNSTLVITDNSANPGPLGLFGFGMTTVLLNLHNAGFYEMNSMILAMGLCYGGSAQIIAGILESRKNNTFGMTAFISYGFFWLSLVALVLMGKWGWTSAATPGAMAAYLAMWALFTLLLFFGTLKINRALQFVFASLTVLFFLLSYADATGTPSVTKLAGYEGIICGGSAIYTGIAHPQRALQAGSSPCWPCKKLSRKTDRNLPYLFHRFSTYPGGKDSQFHKAALTAGFGILSTRGA